VSAIRDDPDAVWVLGEWVPEEWGDVAGHVPAPGELHPRGYAVQPRDLQRSASIADGSTIYPRRVFDSGIRYADDFTFGIAFLEFGDRLAHQGYRIRFLASTHVIHHATPSSIVDAETTDAARMFAMLCHSFLYRRTLGDRLLTVIEIGRCLALSRTQGLRSLRRALVAYRNRRIEIETGR
jgi:hypothetical protein